MNNFFKTLLGSLFFCGLTFLSYPTLANTTPDKDALVQATFMLEKAEQAIEHEAYSVAREHLFDIASWNLNDTVTLFRLGIDLIKIGEFKKSVTIFKLILQRSPNNINVLYNCGYALKSGGFIDEALPYYLTVLARDPHNDAAHLALGYAYLNKGDFINGWPQHERYLKKSGKYAPELRALLAKNSLNGKRILLTPEGGLGDTINFIQCAQLLRDKGARVTALVQKPLLQLLQHCDCVDEVVTNIPSGKIYDAFVTYMSLPAALYLDETTMPQRTPYLHADAQLVDFWTQQLKALEKDTRSINNHLGDPSIHSPSPTALSNTQGDREKDLIHHAATALIQEQTCFAETTTKQEQAYPAKAPLMEKRVGICWQADLPHDESRLPVARRSIPLELLVQLAEIPGVTLYSLQTHKHNAACTSPEINGKIQTFDYPIDTEHGPFMDTAALIANMDLVISVDTATAHLAAALGKPTWLLLPYSTDWRWLVNRTDSPWHPTMRIFKQLAPFDWQSVINTVSQTLLLENKPRY